MPPAPCAMQFINRIGTTFLWMILRLQNQGQIFDPINLTGSWTCPTYLFFFSFFIFLFSLRLFCGAFLLSFTPLLFSFITPSSLQSFYVLVLPAYKKGGTTTSISVSFGFALFLPAAVSRYTNRNGPTFLWNNPGAISLPTLGLRATSQDLEIRCLVRNILKCLPFSGQLTNLFQWPEPRRGRIDLVIDPCLCLCFL